MLIESKKEHWNIQRGKGITESTQTVQVTNTVFIADFTVECRPGVSKHDSPIRSPTITKPRGSSDSLILFIFQKVSFVKPLRAQISIIFFGHGQDHDGCVIIRRL